MTERRGLVDQALADSRPGDMLFIARETADEDPDFFLDAGKGLRNLMAYPAAVEVLERALALEPDLYVAIEQKAICLARTGRAEIPKAKRLLTEALARAEEARQTTVEARAIVARLNKERWRSAWYTERTVIPKAAVRQNRIRAAKDSFYLWCAIEEYVEAFWKSYANRRQRRYSFFEAINALTLLALARYLDQHVSGLQSRSDLLAAGQGVLKKVRPMIPRAVKRAEDGEECYWALATQLEWEVVQETNVDVPEAAARVDDLVTKTIRAARNQRFLLDSTVQQFRLFRCLGFRPALSLPALENLEKALAYTPDPSSPRRRVVFPGCRIDRKGALQPVKPGRKTALTEAAVRSALQKVRQEQEDLLALISPTSEEGLLFAEVCGNLGLGYELFLPSQDAADRLLSSERRARRYHHVERKAREVNLMPSRIGEAPPESDEFRRFSGWMIACGEAFGAPNATLAAVSGRQLRMVEISRMRAARDEIAVTSRRKQKPPARRKAGIAGKRQAAPAPAAAATHKVGPFSNGVEYFFENHLTEATSKRWSSYSDSQRQLLLSLDLKWEPIELGMPERRAASTLGFEVLARGPAGEPFPKVEELCRRERIDPLDMRLALFFKNLNAVEMVRQHPEIGVAPRTDALLITLNADEILVRSEDFERIVAHRQIDPATLVEVNEKLTVQELPELRQIADAYRLRLALDDSNDMDETVRAAMLVRADLVKVDFKYTKGWLERIGGPKPARIMDALLTFREEKRPLVLEGVETSRQMQFLRNHWKRSHGEVYFQGWAIRVSAELRSFFVPLNTEDEPKGYQFTPPGA